MTGGSDAFEAYRRAAAVRLGAIAEARARLAEQAAQDPGSVRGYNSRQARLGTAAKRERRRFELLVLGLPVDEVDPGSDGLTDPAVLRAVLLRDAWSHKNEGTARTHDEASRRRPGALSRLYNGGSLTIEQVAAAEEILLIATSIVADVALKGQSIEETVDRQINPYGAVEGIHRARLCRAYSHWRSMIPAPRAAVLEMILGDPIGEPVGHTVVARRYAMHFRRAKRMLIRSLDLWPTCVDLAYAEIDQDGLDAINAELV